MPLSEHEQRLLDQIERALYDEDPKFASTVRSTDLRTHMRRRLQRAAAVFAVGFVLLVAGVPTQELFIGVIGFIVMLGALLLALSAWRRLGTTTAPTPAPPGSSGSAPVDRPTPIGGRGSGRASRGGSRRSKPDRPKPTGSWKSRLEGRWQRRWDERGRGQ